MRIAISNDHAANELKESLVAHLTAKNIAVTDLFPMLEKSDYPAYALAVADAVADGDYDFGILLCGTGAGMCMTANKVRGIRAVVCSEPYTARLSREHNNAQILCMGARVVGTELAKAIADAFLDANFEGGRHQPRVEMIMRTEERYSGFS
jgi:ribose 5-phosphate isomerase B